MAPALEEPTIPSPASSWGSPTLPLPPVPSIHHVQPEGPCSNPRQSLSFLCSELLVPPAHPDQEPMSLQRPTKPRVIRPPLFLQIISCFSPCAPRTATTWVRYVPASGPLHLLFPCLAHSPHSYLHRPLPMTFRFLLKRHLP